MNPRFQAPRVPAAACALRHAFLPVVLSLHCIATWAQTALSPVVVTATREPLSLDKVTADVVVIDAEHIRTSSADTIEDLLRLEAGVMVQRSGGPGQNASVFIRGASAGNTLVLIDGVRVGSATLGQAEFEGIGMAEVDHIEILRGPGSSLYGADAAGGVVQIFTKRGSGGANRFGAKVAIGGDRSRAATLSASGGGGPWDYAATLSRESSAGVSAVRPNDQFGDYNPDKDGYARSTGQAQFGYTLQPGQRIHASVLAAYLNAQYDSAQFLPPDYTADATPDFRNKLHTTVASVGYDGTYSAQTTVHVQLSSNDDDLRSGGTGIDRFRTRRTQATVQAGWKPVEGAQVVAAYERLDERADADAFTSSKKRANDALILGSSADWAGNLWSLDLRRDSNSVYGANTTGRIGWALPFGAGFKVRALAGTTFRAPTFNDLYYAGYGQIGVQPEHGRSIEAGLEWRGAAADMQATVYRNRLRNLITYQADRTFCPADPSYNFGCAGNIGQARLQGATLSAGERIGNLGLRATVDLIDAHDSQTGERLARRSAHQETVQADYAIGVWSFGASLLDVGARPDGGKRLGGYATVDLQARWRWTPQWQFEAKLLNATDRDIEPIRDYQALGRQAWLGVRFESAGL